MNIDLGILKGLADENRRALSRDYDRYRYGLFSLAFTQTTCKIYWHSKVIAQLRNPTERDIISKLESLYSTYKRNYVDSATFIEKLVGHYNSAGHKSNIALYKLFDECGGPESLGYGLARLFMERKTDDIILGYRKATLKLISANKSVNDDERVWVPNVPFGTNGGYYGMYTFVELPLDYLEETSRENKSRRIKDSLGHVRDNDAPKEDWPEFPLVIAELVRNKYSKLWSKAGTGGNPPTKFTGDDAYRLFTAWCNGDRSNEVLDWRHKRRYNYGSRHRHDFRWRGVIAAIKWGMVLPIGIQKMLETLEEEHAKSR